MYVFFSPLIHIPLFSTLTPRRCYVHADGRFNFITLRSNATIFKRCLLFFCSEAAKRSSKPARRFINVPFDCIRSSIWKSLTPLCSPEPPNFSSRLSRSDNRVENPSTRLASYWALEILSISSVWPSFCCDCQFAALRVSFNSFSKARTFYSI